MNNIYYIYAYLRSKDLTPYYIGKGSQGRAWSLNHDVAVPKDKNRIVIMESNLTELGAFALERRYIKWYGRKDLGTGILRNRTDGGQGGSPSKETREKLRTASLGHSVSSETREKIRFANIGKTYSKELKEKLSKSHSGKISPMRGRTLSPETIEKIKAKRALQVMKPRRPWSEESRKRASETRLKRKIKRSTESIKKGLQTKLENKARKAKELPL